MTMLLIALILTAAAGGEAPAASGDATELLRLHAAVLEAHRNNDVEGLLALEADEIVRVGRGEVRFSTRAERTPGFEKYLRTTEFEEYRDMIEPIVRVSEDGTLGWLIAQVKIAGVQTDDEGRRRRIDSVWAWIELYEKKDGSWRRIGDVSNVKPGG